MKNWTPVIDSVVWNMKMSTQNLPRIGETVQWDDFTIYRVVDIRHYAKAYQNPKIDIPDIHLTKVSPA